MSELIALLTGLAIINSGSGALARAIGSAVAGAVALWATTLLHHSLLAPQGLGGLSTVILAVLASLLAMAAARGLLPETERQGRGVLAMALYAAALALGCWSALPPGDGIEAAATGAWAACLFSAMSAALVPLRARLAAADRHGPFVAPALVLATAAVLALAADGLATVF